MGGWPIDKMTRCRMQASVSRVHPHVHYIPTLELDVAPLPVFAFFITTKNKAALGCSYEDHHLFAHHSLLSIG
jgi:hypothetical protein